MITFKTIAAALTLGTGLCSAADSLSMQLFRELAQSTQGNLAFSPAGVENILNTLKSYSAGETLAELNALPMNENSPKLNIAVQQADGLFVSNKLTLRPDIKNAVTINFAENNKAAQTINQWCAEHTNGRIKKLVQPQDFSSLTAFVATNAIYLKENWMFPFDPDNSFEGEFKTADGRTITTNMMSCTAKFPAAKGEDWVAVALPYAATAQGEQCYFVAISPTKDIRHFATTMTDAKYKDIIGRIGYARGNTRVIMPSFTVDGNTLDLNKALKQAGLKGIFTHADFSRLTTSTEGIFLSKVMQKCFVKVDEQGTEAAAATAAVANLRALPRAVVLDRPFLWFITDLSGTSTPLFMGILEQP